MHFTQIIFHPAERLKIFGTLAVSLVLIFSAPVESQVRSLSPVRIAPIPNLSHIVLRELSRQYAICGTGSQCDGIQASNSSGQVPKSSPSWTRSKQNEDIGIIAPSLYSQSPIKKVPDPVIGWRERVAAKKNGEPFFILSLE